jgi:catechol 2,3-dioxygenase-like lactoylglutathione lyase family enzyme
MDIKICTYLRFALAGIVLTCTATEASAANSPFRDPGVEHVVVIVKDLEATSLFLTRTVGWTRNALLFGSGADPKTYGGSKVVWVDANGIWLELVQPTMPGAEMEVLKGGDGQVTEVDFEVENFHDTFEQLQARGITLVSWSREPLKDGGKVGLPVFKDGAVVGYGDDYAALVPLDIACGIDIEIYQRGFSDASMMKRRDALRPHPMGRADGPELNRILVTSKDPEKAARFFNDVLGQQKDRGGDSVVASVRTTSDGSRAAWIDIEPAPASDTNADGKIREMSAQVNDISAYYDQIKARGVILVDEHGMPLSANRKYVRSPSGTRYAYFPESVSRGMRIRIYQR